jgi:filamentous hemagglutinin family protein
MLILAQIACLLFWTASTEIHAEVSTSITSSGLNTVVTPPPQGGTTYGITHGTQVGNNVFHSFGKFSVGPLDTAQFQTTPLMPDISVSNVLARVTGENPSHLFGTIDSASYYPNANLFFLNPAGIVFGPSAALNVGGSVSFTTATYLRLADGSFFNSVPNAAADALLSATPVEAFGFLNSNAGSITVQGTQLSVSTGSRVALVGGNVMIQTWTLEDDTTQTAKLFAPNGRIHLGSAQSPGEFTSTDLQSIANRDGQLFRAHGAVLLSPNSWIDNSNSDTSVVSIHNGKFSLNVTNSILSTKNTNPTTHPTNSIALAEGSRILGTTTSGADGATIQVATGSLEIRNGSQIVTSNEGSQVVEGGANVVATDAITISGYGETSTSGIWSDAGIIPSGIFTGTLASGRGGALTISTPKLTIENSGEVATFATGAGSGQPITINVEQLSIRAGGRIASTSGWNYLSRGFGNGPGQAGPITIQGADSISIAGIGSFDNQSTIQTAAFGSNGGSSAFIKIITPSATMNIENGGRIETLPGSSTEPTGNITLTIRDLNISNGSIRTSGGNGRSGNISVIASNAISLKGNGLGQPPFSITNENVEGTGGTGVIKLETRTLTLSDQAKVYSSTFSDPTTSPTPKIDIRATASIISNDRSDIRIVSTLSPVGSMNIVSPTISLSHYSTLNTIGQGTGNSGAITINTNDFSLNHGSQINSSILSGSSGHGGPIEIIGLNGLTSAQSIRISGPVSGVFSETKGPGKGGQITTLSSELRLTDHATISSKTSGSGDAGNILIKSDDVSVMGGAKITAESTGTGNAGTVTIQGLHSPANSFLLDGFGSSILTSTTKTGAGGNITIDAKDVQLRNGGKISAETSGTSTSATGGTIDIDGSYVRIEKGALVTASTTGAATGGTIKINAAQTVENSGGSVETTATQAQAGDIEITAGQSITLTNGAITSTRSEGPGNAGTISIDAGQQFDMQDSSVTAEAKLASGGNIDIKAVDLIRVANSTISSSVQGGPSTAGGNITIDPKTVVLQNAQILASAEQGNGGNIEITTPLFLKDSTSNVDASSRFGLSGTVTIQSPTSNISGTVGQLASKTSPPQVLLQNRCVALAGGEQSTFILAGRNTLPLEPGGWLSSPVSMEHWTGVSPEHASTLMVQSPSRRLKTWPAKVAPKSETNVLSLRRLTPPGFLVRAFATPSTGCPS